jgi:uncharacterized phage protein (TIGR01671 family)
MPLCRYSVTSLVTGQVGHFWRADPDQFSKAPKPIKFRAWDKANSETVYEIESMVFARNGEPANVDIGFSNPVIANGDDPQVVPMQFTGLKDKNGKDVYEKDIIYRNSWKVPLDENRKADYAMVEFQRDGFVGRRFEEEHGTPLYFFFDGNPLPFEVIGNIYENPELLK